ncbi:hypothetical protein GCM10009552_30510 [Rothia nasimurium]
MDHRIGFAGALAHAVQVFQRATDDPGAGGGQRFSTGIRAHETTDLVPMGKQFLYDGRADEAGGSGDEYVHGVAPSLVDGVTLVSMDIGVKS